MYNIITVLGFNFHYVIYCHILLLLNIIISLQLRVMYGCYCMKTFILNKTVDSRTPWEL